MIYFVRHAETGLIKIGKTHTYDVRFIALENQYGSLALLGVMDGYSNQETDLHIQFSHLNVRDILTGREWFRDNGEIQRYVTHNTHLDLSKYTDGVFTDISEVAQKRPSRELNSSKGSASRTKNKTSPSMRSNIPKLVSEKQMRDRRNYKNVEIAENVGISSTMVAHFLDDEVDISRMTFATGLAWSDWLECDFRELGQPIAEDAT